VEAFWAAAAAEPGTVKELVNVEARLCNKAQGLGSSIAPSLGNRAEFDFAPGVQSLYKSDLCSTHKRVGKRGVVQPEAAMAAVRRQGACALRQLELPLNTGSEQFAVHLLCRQH
jgi:hypothetical protein